MLIIFEGIDGSGKTTLACDVYNWVKENYGKMVILYHPTSKFPYKYFAKEYFDIAKLGVNERYVVICDRYYISEFVYSRYAGNEFDENILNLDGKIRGNAILFYLKVSCSVCKARKKIFEYDYDKLNRIYEDVIQHIRLPSKDIIVIDGDCDKDVNFKKIISILKERI